MMVRGLRAAVVIPAFAVCAAASSAGAAGLSMKPLDVPVLAGRAVTFEAEAGAGAAIQWDFGDGGVTAGGRVSHTFRQPGIYPVWLSRKGGHSHRRLAAIVRVRDRAVASVPKVLLDTDARCEADDQHFIGYALFSEVDVLGVGSVHNGAGTESINYGEIHYVFRLARESGWSSDHIPLTFHGADDKLQVPESGRWFDTQPIVTEASEAILAAARGASPESPAWILAVGAGTNVASAILQARKQGLDLKGRIRIIWLGGHAKDYHQEHNGAKDPWSVYVMGQSGVDLQILLSHPTSLKLHIDKRVESGLYPDNALGRYLLQITPVFQWRSTRPKALHDACVLATVIGGHLGLDWVKEVEPTRVSGPRENYTWQPADNGSAVRLIRDIDGEAMKTDLFDTLNGKPLALRRAEPGSPGLARDHDRESRPAPRVILDTDAKNEVDDQHFIGYGLFSELDTVGINNIHHGGGQEATNYAEIQHVIELSRKSGLPQRRVPPVFHGADRRLVPPPSGRWFDTEPIVTEASEAILAAARGASPDNRVWVLPVGPCTNIASAILQARREDLDLGKRIRICWLGGGPGSAHKETFNGGNDPWSVYVTAQSGVDFWILLENPTGASLRIDKRIESGLYPDNDLGRRLLKITPVFNWNGTKLKPLFDLTTIAMVISEHLGLNWLTKVEPARVLGPQQDYAWERLEGATAVRIIRDIDEAAMKKDFFSTLNGRPTRFADAKE